MEFEESPSRPIVLSRSVLLTEESSIPSLLLLGKLVSDGSLAGSAASLLPDKLRQIWRPSGTVNFWRVSNGTFLVQFYEAEDLTKAHDGAPWSCGDGHDLFLMDHVNSDTNIVDQIAGFTKADLWVRFHGVPVEYFSANSVYALAAAVGEPVNCELSHTSSVDFIRARVRVDITRPLKRSVAVKLANDEQASVSVEYEVVPGLCGSCGILGHPADRCPRRENHSVPSRPAVYAPSPSHLGPGRSTSSSHRGKSSRRYEPDNLPASPGVTSGQERLSPVNATCFNFSWKLKSWRKGVGRSNSSSTWDDSQHQIVHPTPNQQENKEPSMMEAQETPLGTTSITHSHFIVKAQGYASRSMKHARIEVVVETHCSPQLIKGAMQWLSKKKESTGLDAEYDGTRGVISIFGLQIDENTDPVDLIAYVHPKKIGLKVRLAETQTKPDSPARFTDTMRRVHDANCYKDASKE
ncbi:unnamed protein product [Alopecurus aequalis]